MRLNFVATIAIALLALSILLVTSTTNPKVKVVIEGNKEDNTTKLSQLSELPEQHHASPTIGSKATATQSSSSSPYPTIASEVTFVEWQEPTSENWNQPGQGEYADQIKVGHNQTICSEECPSESNVKQLTGSEFDREIIVGFLDSRAEGSELPEPDSIDFIIPTETGAYLEAY